MQLIENEDLSEVLKEFPFPSDPKKIISGPDDLTRAQAKALGQRIKANQDAEEEDFFSMVFVYWATLPGARWNLARKGQPIPLDAESIERELRKGDFSDLAVLVTKHIYPYMFRENPEQAAETDDDVMDGLEVEEGSQAALELAGEPDPNAWRPPPGSVAN